MLASSCDWGTVIESGSNCLLELYKKKFEIRLPLLSCENGGENVFKIFSNKLYKNIDFQFRFSHKRKSFKSFP